MKETYPHFLNSKVASKVLCLSDNAAMSKNPAGEYLTFEEICGVTCKRKSSKKEIRLYETLKKLKRL